MTESAYAGNILKVDLSSGRCSDMPTLDYAERFVGGRGIAAKIYWDEVQPQVAVSNGVLFVCVGCLDGAVGGVDVVEACGCGAYINSVV